MGERNEIVTRGFTKEQKHGVAGYIDRWLGIVFEQMGPAKRFTRRWWREWWRWWCQCFL